MQYRKFDQTILARFDKGEEITECLEAIARTEHITLAHVEALGAVCDVTVGVFFTAEKEYHANHFLGDFEIVSLHGTMTTKDGSYYGHYHMSIGDQSGAVVGGHLTRAVVSATCEVVITLLSGSAERIFDPETGLNLIKFPD